MQLVRSVQGVIYPQVSVCGRQCLVNIGYLMLGGSNTSGKGSLGRRRRVSNMPTSPDAPG